MVNCILQMPPPEKGNLHLDRCYSAIFFYNINRLIVKLKMWNSSISGDSVRPSENLWGWDQKCSWLCTHQSMIDLIIQLVHLVSCSISLVSSFVSICKLALKFTFHLKYNRIWKCLLSVTSKSKNVVITNNTQKKPFA